MSVSTRPYIDPVEGLIARAKHTAAPLALPTTDASRNGAPGMNAR